MAHALMGSPIYALVSIRRGIIEHVEADYDMDALIVKGTQMGKSNFHDEDDIAVWESHHDIDQSFQVWHYEMPETHDA